MKPLCLKLALLTAAAVIALASARAFAQAAPAAGTTAPPKDAKAANVAAPGTAAPASDLDKWADEIKNPCNFFKWGADLRLREKYLGQVITLDDVGAAERNRERHFQRYRARIWGDFFPNENIGGYVRMTWESRYYGQPNHSDPPATQGPDQPFYGGPIVFDNLYLRLNKIADLPLNVTVGRQDIIMHDGWLVLDGTPLDGSRTIYFDAVKANLELKELNSALTLVYIDQAGTDDRWLNPISNFEEDQIEQDERGVIVDWAYKGFKDTPIDAYFIYKYAEPTSRANPYRNAGFRFNSYADDGEVYTVGGRVACKIDDNWSARVEGAHQFGHKRGLDIVAFGALSRLTYSCNDSLKNQFKLNYEYMSGDKPDSNEVGQFDPLWGRWPQFSELYVYSYAPETRIGEVTNLHRIGAGWQCEPLERTQLLIDYHALFADQNPTTGQAHTASMPTFVDGDGYFRGHLVTAVLKHKFNRFVAGHLWGELFFPGNFYGPTHDDMATFLRAEVMLTW